MLVPKGEFSMGGKSGFANEEPVHRVMLDAFYMDKYEVTVGQ
jgi:formylglycine-generating enzyme